MSRSTISTFQLFQMFPDEETARLAKLHCRRLRRLVSRKLQHLASQDSE